MQEKTSELTAISSRVGLNIQKCKTKILKVNAISMEPVKLEGKQFDEVETFTYKHGSTDAGVNARIGKARGAFIQL